MDLYNYFYFGELNLKEISKLDEIDFVKRVFPIYKAINLVSNNSLTQNKSTIGFVGTSGKSTGPHLHYEVIFNNQQINPYNLRMPEIAAINKDSLKSFELEKSKILTLLEKLKKKN